MLLSFFSKVFCEVNCNFILRWPFKYSQRFNKCSTMSERYFSNILQDYTVGGQPFEIPEATLTQLVTDIESKIAQNIKPTEKNADGGIYLGVAGIAYMYYHLSKTPSLKKFHSKFRSSALEYLKPSLKDAEKKSYNLKDVPALLLGNGGVYAVASVLYDSLGDGSQSNHFRKLYYNAAATCKKPNFLPCGSDEILVGRAGYVCGALWMAKHTNIPIDTQEIYEICRVMVDTGRNYSRSHNSASPLMYSYYNVEYVGAAHGLADILQVIMSVPGYLESNPIDAKDIKSSVDYVLSLQDAEGNFPSDAEEIGQIGKVIHWCHGAGGIIYLMAKAFLIWNEEKYLMSCDKMAELIWHKGLLRKGPGICHGVAGSGYAFLLMHRLTGNPKHLHRAFAFANFMESIEFKKGARTPDYQFSLYEGLAGTACFLTDLATPSTAAFPFSDVF